MLHRKAIFAITFVYFSHLTASRGFPSFSWRCENFSASVDITSCIGNVFVSVSLFLGVEWHRGVVLFACGVVGGRECVSETSNSKCIEVKVSEESSVDW